ncbi:hypothetical protein XELAEV_18017348mg [Xenopus laevis]|uniref:Uncharacterized protein n=1 Tax=Xenopus laevis TaxID=8355 RepID=A0A974DB17_XENLA|nr:hypothetical protein XELAEV_18017348mg [Xenopus laevis]
MITQSSCFRFTYTRYTVTWMNENLHSQTQIYEFQILLQSVIFGHSVFQHATILNSHLCFRSAIKCFVGLCEKHLPVV